MDTLIISDVHGNLPALEYVIHKHKSVDKIISLGDVVNYGPWSNECVDLLNTIENKVLIVGNHEEIFLKGSYEGTNLIAQTFFKFCYPQFSRKQEISNYLSKYAQDNCVFVHTLANKYIFPDSVIEIERDTFIGHSHRLFSNLMNGFRLVNVGSVGQNRINIDQINYALWDSGTNAVKLCTDNFSADSLINEMKAKKYPTICLDYIMSKRINNGK